MRKIGKLIKSASHQLTRNLDNFAKPYDLTGTQMMFIDFLVEKAGQSCLQRDLEQEFHIQRSTTTAILQGMEKKGLIIRQISEQDARQRLVCLTEKARQLAPSCSLFFEQEEELLSQHFSAEERQHFEKILRFMIQGENHVDD